MGRGSLAKQEIRRRKTWLHHIVQGYTQGETAERLGVSRRTIVRDMAYLKEHPEEIPVVPEEELTAFVRTRLTRLLEEGELTDWQKVKILRDLARSTVTRKEKKEERMEIAWGHLSEEDTEKP